MRRFARRQFEKKMPLSDGFVGNAVSDAHTVLTSPPPIIAVLCARAYNQRLRDYISRLGSNNPGAATSFQCRSSPLLGRIIRAAHGQ